MTDGMIDTVTRMLCLWCPDWPVVAARRRDPALDGRPVAVLRRGFVLAASVEARAEGVRRGLRRREAEARCPGLVTLPADPAGEGRAFEEVARAVEVTAPRLALERPGLLFVPTRGPSRYFGGDAALAERIVAVTPGGRVGVADGAFAARLAARRASPGEGFVVPAGDSAAFLAPWPVRVLGARGVPGDAADDRLASLLVRLGLPRLGDFAALPPAAVLGRFGEAGLVAHRQARGLEEHRPHLRVPAAELEATHEFDPPAVRVETAVFAGRALAERLSAALAADGLACTRVRVEADTEHGERLARCWRLDSFGPSVLAERIRGQLEAWVSVGEGTDDDTVSGGLTLLRLVPEEVVVAGRSQLGLWGGDRAAAERAARAFVRLQAQLGPEAVAAPGLTGGRTPDERVNLVPWGEPPENPEEAPWPGAVPAPAPAIVFRPARPAELLDAAGAPVTVSARGEASEAPARLACPVLPRGGGPVEAWAGPWLHDLRWWDSSTRRRRALWQVVAAGVACLVATEGGEARLEAIYD